jgi:hypothetical protein
MRMASPPFTGRSGRVAAREFIRLSKSRDNNSLPWNGEGFLAPRFRVDSGGAGGHPAATRLGYREQASAPDPAGPTTSRTQHSCGLRRPNPAGSGGCVRVRALAGPDTYSFPAPWPFEVAAGSLPGGGVPFGRAHGRGGSSGDASWSGAALWRGSGGLWDVASAASPLPWDSVTLSPLVPRPTPAAPRVVHTAVPRRSGHGRRPIQASGCRGCGRGHPNTDSWSTDNGLSSLGLAPLAPVRRRLAGRAVAQCLTKRLTSKTSLVCSMW